MIRLIFTFFIFIFIHKNVLCNANQEMVIKYLTNFDTLESDFIQINNDGATTTGKILIIVLVKFESNITKIHY